MIFSTNAKEARLTTNDTLELISLFKITMDKF